MRFGVSLVRPRPGLCGVGRGGEFVSDSDGCPPSTMGGEGGTSRCRDLRLGPPPFEFSDANNQRSKATSTMPPLPDLDHGRCRAVDFLKPPVPPPGDDADVDSSTPMATMGTAAAGRRGVISSATAMVFVDAHSLTDGTTTTTALSLFGDGGCDGGGRTGRGTDVDDGTYGPPSALVDFRNDGIITLFLPLAAGGGDDVPPRGRMRTSIRPPRWRQRGLRRSQRRGRGRRFRPSSRWFFTSSCIRPRTGRRRPMRTSIPPAFSRTTVSSPSHCGSRRGATTRSR